MVNQPESIKSKKGVGIGVAITLVVVTVLLAGGLEYCVHR